MKKTLNLCENKEANDFDENEAVDKFRMCLERQIKLENQLRNLKGRISHYSRTDIINKFKAIVKKSSYKGKYCQYDIEQMLSIEFEEYDPL